MTSFRKHILKVRRPNFINFTKFLVLIACGRVAFPSLWRRYDFNISGFVDDIYDIFAPTPRPNSQHRQRENIYL